MFKKILIIGSILAVVGGIYGYSEWNRKPASTESKKADKTLTANELAAQFDNAQHLGKVLEVSGKIASVETQNGVTNIVLETSDPMISISCEMEKEGETPSVKMGEDVVLRGQCDGKLTDVQMTRCIVLKR